VVGHAKTVSAVAPSPATGTEQVTFADLTPSPAASTPPAIGSLLLVPVALIIPLWS
jgi:hypothetical protein